MTAPNLHHTPARIPHVDRHHTLQWMGLLILAVLVIAIAVVSLPAPAIMKGRPAGVDPAASAVLNYIHVHEMVKPIAAVDPAASAVLNYVRAHEAVDQAAVVAAPLDPWCYESGENYQLCTRGR